MKVLLAFYILLCGIGLAVIIHALYFGEPNGRAPSTYGLNDVSLRLRATWINPFVTDLDPRRLLVLAAAEIETMEQNNPVAAEMRLLWDDPFSPKYNLRDLLRKGADEIDRLESEYRTKEKDAVRGFFR